MKSSSRSLIWPSHHRTVRDGVWSEGEEEEEEEKASERRGFQDGMDLRLCAMMQLT